MGQQCCLPRSMARDHLRIGLLGKSTSMNTSRNVTECPCPVTVFLCITILIDTRLVITMGKDTLEWLIPRFDHRCSNVHRCIPVITTIVATGPRSIKTESASGAAQRCAGCRHRCLGQRGSTGRISPSALNCPPATCRIQATFLLRPLCAPGRLTCNQRRPRFPSFSIAAKSTDRRRRYARLSSAR